MGALLLSALLWALPKTTRVYFVGNSVTDTLNYQAFAKLFEARGRKLEWGRHVIPGTPLFLPWQGAEAGRTDGFVEPPYGNSVKALTQFDWDVLTLQPFDRHEKDLNDKGYDEGDVASARRYIAAAAKRNPNVRVFVYARWPRMSVQGKGVAFDKRAYLEKNPGAGKPPFPEGLDAWQALWERPYTGGWDGTNETKAYFEKVTQAIRDASPDLRQRVRTIPVGHAMADLNRSMQAGKVRGYRTVWELYNDAIHLDEAGAYLVGCTFYSSITGEDPHGLPASAYGVKNPDLAKSIEDAAWHAVQAASKAKL